MKTVNLDQVIFFDDHNTKKDFLTSDLFLRVKKANLKKDNIKKAFLLFMVEVLSVKRDIKPLYKQILLKDFSISKTVEDLLLPPNNFSEYLYHVGEGILFNIYESYLYVKKNPTTAKYYLDLIKHHHGLLIAIKNEKKNK